MMIATVLLLLLAGPSDAQARNPGEIKVDQLGDRSAGKPDIQVDHLGSPAGRSAVNVSQLPETLEADEDAAQSEPALASAEKRDLTAEVARAWELIRQRGQQPTPELIAREIGPDTLTAFLNQNPEGIDIFTRDAAPVEPQLPDGSDGQPVILLPPGHGQ